MNEIEELVHSIDQSMKEISNEKLPTKIPNNLQIILSGVSDEIGVQTLFSDKIDSVIGKLFDCIISGNYSAVENGTNILDSILTKIGLNQYSFEGELSKRIMQTMADSISSAKFNKTRSNLKKGMIILKDLQRESKNEDNPIKKKKLEDATYAIKKVFKITAKIYSQRKHINNRVKRGLNTIVNESST